MKVLLLASVLFFLFVFEAGLLHFHNSNQSLNQVLGTQNRCFVRRLFLRHYTCTHDCCSILDGDFNCGEKVNITVIQREHSSWDLDSTGTGTKLGKFLGEIFQFLITLVENMNTVMLHFVTAQL